MRPIDPFSTSRRGSARTSDTATANAVLRWYDSDSSGRIELPEFAVLARDLTVFTTFDVDHSGKLSPFELEQAVKHSNLQQIKLNLAQDAEAERLRHALFTKFAEENEREPDVSYHGSVPDDEKQDLSATQD